MSTNKKEQEEPESHDRWLVSYADFITLLFAFFVVMYATSTNNQEKQKSFEQSVRVNLKLGGVGANTSDGAPAGEGMMQGNETKDAVIPLEGFPRGKGPGETQDYINRFLDKKLDQESKDKIQNVRHDAVGVRISLASAQFFNPGGTKLRVSALKALSQIAELLKDNTRKVIIEGHTDNMPVAKNAEYDSNWELGSLRATSIVRYLIRYHQIDPSRLAAISYADTRPINKNDSEEGRSQNRRIEIYIVLEDKGSEY